MGKWIAAIAAVGIVVLAILMWLELHETPTAAAARPAPVAAVPAPQTPSASQLAALGAQLQAEDKRPDGKLSPNSDEFFYKFSEAHTKRLTELAASCYTGGLDRVGWNEFLRLTFHDKIVNGEVTFTDIQIGSDSTITNKKLVDCFVKQVQNAHWHDDTLPNLDDDDELVLRPERGMKKYLPENRDYEGAGPDFTNHKYE